jgi:hypothetical protein
LRKTLLLISLLYLAPSESKAQSVFADKHEFGILLGGSNYFGDLAYNIVPAETHPAVGLLYRYRFSPYLAARAGLCGLQISGNDANFEEYANRNLHFKNNLIEFSAQMEFNLWAFTGALEHKRKYFTPYALLGLAVFNHDPKAEFDGKWVKLREAGTEGQTMNGGPAKYKQFQISVPIGVGVKYQLSKNWILGFEVGYRKTFTDYLDDVSSTYPEDYAVMQKNASPKSALLSHRSAEINNGIPLTDKGDMRGDPAHKDWYIIAGLTIMYNLVGDNCP